MINIIGVEPYLFVPLPRDVNPTESTLSNIRNELNKQGTKQMNFNANVTYYITFKYTSRKAFFHLRINWSHYLLLWNI